MSIIKINKMNKTKRALRDAGFSSMTATGSVFGRGKGLWDAKVLEGVKNDQPEALELLGFPQNVQIAVNNLSVNTPTCQLGNEIEFSFEIQSSSANKQNLMIDFIVHYMKANGRTAPKVFKLSNTEKINKRWRGKAYNELDSSDQRRIRSTTIHAIIFEQRAPADNDTSLYQVFERINTGGRALMPQEIRNCVNQGSFNDLLFDLNKNQNWRTLFGKEEEDSRMRDLEFILRFLGLDTDFIRTSDVSVISLKKYLNEFMGSAKSQCPKTIQERRDKFNYVMNFAHTYIGDNAFYNIVSGEETKIRKRFYPTIFDAICPAISIAHKKLGNDMPTENLEEKRLALLKDPDFRKFSSEGTMQISHIHGRINKALNYLFGISYE